MRKYQKIGSLLGLTLLGGAIITVPFVSTSCGNNKKEQPTKIDLVDLKVGATLAGATLTFNTDFNFSDTVPTYHAIEIVANYSDQWNTYLGIIKSDDIIIEFYQHNPRMEFTVYNSGIVKPWIVSSYIVGLYGWDILDNVKFLDHPFDEEPNELGALPPYLRGLCQVTWSS